jgi:activator of HSP90 ATPase
MVIVQWVHQRTAMSSVVYCSILIHFHWKIQQWCKGKWVEKVFVIQDNTMPHTTLQITQT